MAKNQKMENERERMEQLDAALTDYQRIKAEREQLREACRVLVTAGDSNNLEIGTVLQALSLAHAALAECDKRPIKS